MDVKNLLHTYTYEFTNSTAKIMLYELNCNPSHNMILEGKSNYFVSLPYKIMLHYVKPH